LIEDVDVSLRPVQDDCDSLGQPGDFVFQSLSFRDPGLEHRYKDRIDIFRFSVILGIVLGLNKPQLDPNRPPGRAKDLRRRVGEGLRQTGWQPWDQV
jgi:hypothetical protein